MVTIGIFFYFSCHAQRWSNKPAKFVLHINCKQNIQYDGQEDWSHIVPLMKIGLFLSHHRTIFMRGLFSDSRCKQGIQAEHGARFGPLFNNVMMAIFHVILHHQNLYYTTTANKISNLMDRKAHHKSFPTKKRSALIAPMMKQYQASHNLLQHWARMSIVASCIARISIWGENNSDK